MILGFYSIKEISEHIFDEGPESIDFEGIFSVFNLSNYDMNINISVRCFIIFEGKK